MTDTNTATQTTRTSQEIFDRLAATRGQPSEVMYAEAEKLAKETGQRLPTAFEVLEGYSSLLAKSGMAREEAMMFTLAAAFETKNVMQSNDAKATSATKQ